MKRSLMPFIVMILCFFYGWVNAQEMASEKYIIKKGDTLWGISDLKLKDPFLWPKLWKVNPQIKNPDLIYPGAEIRIPSKEELMRMFPVEKAPAVAKPSPPEPEIETLVEITEEAPPEYIVDKNLYIASGWISPDVPGIGHITGSPSGQTILGNNDVVYLKTDKELVVGERLLAIRDIKIVRHPVTGKELGHLIRVTGILEVTDPDVNLPKARITNIFEEVQTGDGLMPYKEMEPPTIPADARTPDISGYIVESYRNSLMSGLNDIVYLDKGLDDGLKAGDLFSVFSTTSVESPLGLLQVISLHPQTSTAIILKSEKEITVGDKWGK